MAKSVINKINTGSAEYNIASTAYCTCATAAATAAKVAYVQGDDASATTGFTLVQGVTVHVKFTYSNTATNPTLSINGSTAKPIMRYGTTAVGKTAAASWRAGAIVSITYDGTNWVLNSSIDDNNTYTIPTVNNATLTIQKNSSTVATFTANSSTNTTANITVPTKVSELTNDSGYKTTDTTYTIATGDSNGQIKVTPSVGDAYNVSVKGLGSAAYTNSSAYAAASHGTHVTFGGNGSATTVSRFDHTHSNYVTSATFDEFTEYAENTYLADHQTIKQDGITGATINRYGVCSTTASTAAKTVSITSGTFNLEVGARVTVKFSNPNSASNPTLNVNSKGAKNIYYKGTRITTGDNKHFLTGVMEFIYDGTQFHVVSPNITATGIGAAPSSHSHSGYCMVAECGTYPELGALKYDVTEDCYENCFIKGILGSNYFWGFVQLLDSGYFVHLWSNDAIYRLTYSSSTGTWTDDIRYYAQSNKLPSFSLSGTVLTITDNN